MVFRNEDVWAMDARWQGQTHRIELNGKLNYQGPLFDARFDPDSFEPEQLEASPNAHDGDFLSLEAVASMYVLLKGLSQSLPYLPTALAVGLATRGKIPHPGYAD